MENFSQSSRKIVVRSASSSPEKITNFFKKYGTISDGVHYIITLYQNNTELKKALYIASYTLYKILVSYTESPEKFSIKKKNKLGLSLLKYYIRYCTRPTPFGLYAGVGVGEIDVMSNITLNDSVKSLHVRFDMDFLYQISVSAIESGVIKNIKYIQNSTLYSVQNNFRYIEFGKDSGRRQYSLQNIESTELLEGVLKFCSDERSSDDIVLWLNKLGADDTEATSYLVNLINNQVLIPTALPTTLDDFQHGRLLNYEFSTLKYSDFIKNSYEKLNSINAAGDFNISDLELFRTKINNTFEFESPNNLFQIDKKLNFTNATLSSKDIGIFKEVIPLLLMLQSTSDSSLDYFKRAFFERYETEEIPLSHALDSEIGIGYKQARSIRDLHQRPIGTKWNMANSFKWNIIQESNLSLGNSIKLSKSSFDNMESKVELLPSSLQIMFVPLEKEGKPYYYFKSASGPNVNTLTGRFTHLSNELESEYLMLGEIDKLLKKEYVIAEINHLPQERLGNIMFRTNAYDYEIPYLASTSVDREHVLNIQDLQLSMVDNTMYLRCKRLNKYILPRLSCAHNYSSNSLPTYHLLCDLQYQGVSDYISWDWGFLNEEPFLPRIEYKNIILARSQWCIKKNSKTESLSNLIKRYKRHYKLPALFCIVIGDNELLVSIDTEIGLELFEEHFRKKEKIICAEYLYSEFKSLVKNNSSEAICSEIITTISYDHSMKSSNTPRTTIANNEVERMNFSGNQWIYFKLYANQIVTNKIIRKLFPLISNLKEAKYVEKWFFIRYSDPKPHLRVRLKSSSQEHYYLILKEILNEINKLTKSGLISDYQMLPYKREIERYTPQKMEVSESLFDWSSTFVLTTIVQLKSELEIFCALIYQINEILDFCSIRDTQKLSIYQEAITSFRKEFGSVLTEISTQVKRQYREILIEMESRNIYNFKELINNDLEVDNLKKICILLSDGISPSQLSTLIKSHIHMILNRTFYSNQRLQEFILYQYLERSLRSKIVLNNQLI